MKKIGGPFEAYSSMFEENMVTGKFLVGGCKEEHLQGIVPNSLHRAVLWEHILELKNYKDPPPPPAPKKPQPPPPTEPYPERLIKKKN